MFTAAVLITFIVAGRLITEEVEAATIEVNSTGDLGDSNPGNGLCDTGGLNSEGDTECTLRGAIEEANVLTGEDQIGFNIPTSDPLYSDNGTPDSDDDFWTIQPTVFLPYVLEEVVIDARTQPSTSCQDMLLKIEIDGSNDSSMTGLEVRANYVEIYGFVINNFYNGIYYNAGASNSKLQCNIIGLDPDGDTIQPNRTGVYFWNNSGTDPSVITVGNTSGHQIGGNVSVERNIISGNSNRGVYAYPIRESLIQGNYIGTDKTGFKGRGNAFGALLLASGSSDNIIGGDDAAVFGGNCVNACNLISGNSGWTFYVGQDSTRYNTIKGNFIGTDVSGTQTIGNSGAGITIRGADYTLIENNLISGNQYGIVSQTEVGSCNDNTIRGNYFGLDTTGEISLGNLYNHVNATSGSPQTTSNLTIEDNLLRASGRSAISLSGTTITNTQISGNTISDSKEEGIFTWGTTSVAIYGNSIYKNEGLGIKRSDGSSQCPDITSFTTSETDISILGTYGGVPSMSYRIDFYSNIEQQSGGRTHLGYSSFTTDALGGYDFVATPLTISSLLPEGQSYISSTVTSCSDQTCTILIDTSEFSINIEEMDGVYSVNSTEDAGDEYPGDGQCNTGSWNSEGDTECTLRAAIEEANAIDGDEVINFNIPQSDSGCLSFVDDSSVSYNPYESEVNCLAENADPEITWWRILSLTDLPVITEDLTIDGSTQSGYVENTQVPPEVLDGQPVIEINCSGLDTCFSAENDFTSPSSIAIYGLVVNSASYYNLLLILGSGGASTISGNYIGTDISGKRYISGTFSGVYVLYGDNITIGGFEPSERNLLVADTFPLFGKDQNGIDDFSVYGNIVGQLNDGSSVINSRAAIGIDHDMGSNVGDGSIEGMNVISGGMIEGGVSIWCTGRNTEIKGNLIKNNNRGIALWCSDTGVIEDNIIENSILDGIYCYYSCNNMGIDNNFLRNNNGYGIHIHNGINNLLSQNSIYANGGLGINLVGGTENGYGVTANDAGDTDSGPNNLMNYPEIERVVYKGGGEYYISGDLDYPGTATIEIFESDIDESEYGEGKRYLGSTTASSPWEMTPTGLEQGMSFTATATDEDGNTSEFSLNREITLWIEAEKEAEYIDRDVSGTLTQGDEIEYRIVVKNNGTSTIEGVKVEDEIPEGTKIVEGSIVTTSGTIASTNPIRIEGMEIVGGGSEEIRFRVRLIENTGSEIINQARVYYDITGDGVNDGEVLSDDPSTEDEDDPTVLGTEGVIEELPETGEELIFIIIIGIIVITFLVKLKTDEKTN